MAKHARCWTREAGVAGTSCNLHAKASDGVELSEKSKRIDYRGTGDPMACDSVGQGMQANGSDVPVMTSMNDPAKGNVTPKLVTVDQVLQDSFVGFVGGVSGFVTV